MKTATAEHADQTEHPDETDQPDEKDHPRAKPVRLRSVRLRAAAAAVTVLAVVLIASAALVLTFSRAAFSLDRVGEAAQQHVGILASRLATGESYERIIEETTDAPREDGLIQIIDASGRVLGSSEELQNETALTFDAWPQEVSVRDDDGEESVYVAVRAFVPDSALASAGTQIVYLRGLDEAELPSQILSRLFFFGIPIILLTVGATTWWLTGRAMRPVEEMRREVEAITAASLDRRLVHPGGRDEIARLATTMNGMLDRLYVSQQSQRRFISDASHELRSPIATIRQFAEVSVAYPGKLGEEQLAENTLKESIRMQRLVESLLFLARSDEEQLAVAKTPIDVDDLLAVEARRIRSSTSLTVIGTGISAAQTIGSAPLLERVIRNLVDNATRHATTTVALSCGIVSDRVWVSIDDDGVGVPPDDRQRVFERFVRLDDARSRDTGGSGLGLSIVREIVLAHQGHVRVEESQLGGARFVLFLPQFQGDTRDPSA